MLCYVIGLLQGSDVAKAQMLCKQQDARAMAGTFATGTADPLLSMVNTTGVRVYSLLHNEVKDLSAENFMLLYKSGAVSTNLNDMNVYMLYSMGTPLIINGVVKANAKRFVLGQFSGKYLCYNPAKGALYLRTADELQKSEQADKTPYIILNNVEVDVNEINPALQAKILSEVGTEKQAPSQITGFKAIQQAYGNLDTVANDPYSTMREIVLNEQQSKPLEPSTIEDVPRMPNVTDILTGNKSKANAIDQKIKSDISQDLSNQRLSAKRKLISAEKPTLLPGQIYCDNITVKAGNGGRNVEDKALTVQQAFNYAAKMLEAIDPYLYVLFNKYKKVAITNDNNKENIPTLAVSIDTIYYNIDYVATLSMGQLVFSLLHELYHIFMKHVQRGRKKDAWLWNLATDLVVNGNIAKNYRLSMTGGEQVYKGKYRNKDVNVPIEVRPGYNYSPELDVSKETAETVYQDIVEAVKKELQQQGQQGQNGQQGQQGQGQGQGQQGQGQQSQGQNGQNGQQGQSGQQGQGQQGQGQGQQGSGSQQDSQQGGSQQGNGGQGSGQQGNNGGSQQGGGSPQGSDGQQGNQQGSGGGGQQGDNSQGNGQGNGQESTDGSGQDSNGNGQGSGGQGTEDSNEQGQGNSGGSDGQNGDTDDGSDDIFKGKDGSEPKDVKNPFTDKDIANKEYNSENQRKSLAPNVEKDENGNIKSVTVNYKGRQFKVNYDDLDITEDENTIDKTDEEVNEMAERKEVEVKEAVKLHNEHGSSDMLRKAEDGEPIRDILWERFLHRYLNEATKNKKSFRNPSRKYIPSGILLKGRIKADKDAIKGVYVCIDTSGSVSDLELGIAFGIIEGTLQKYGVTGKVLFWDTQVKAVGEFKNTRELLVARKLVAGGGGTSPDCIFEYFNSKQCKDKPDLVIIMTDGMFGNLRQAPSRKFGDVLWVLTDSQQSYERFKPPFGKKAPLSMYS